MKKAFDPIGIVATEPQPGESPLRAVPIEETGPRVTEFVAMIPSVAEPQPRRLRKLAATD